MKNWEYNIVYSIFHNIYSYLNAFIHIFIYYIYTFFFSSRNSADLNKLHSIKKVAQFEFNHIYKLKERMLKRW